MSNMAYTFASKIPRLALDEVRCVCVCVSNMFGRRKHTLHMHAQLCSVPTAPDSVLTALLLVPFPSPSPSAAVISLRCVRGVCMTPCQTLFYQHAYNAMFLDQFALISRRSSAKAEAMDDGDAAFVLSTEEVLNQSTIFVCTTMVRERVWFVWFVWFVC